MTKEKKLLVAAIKNGTVIDHITAGHALKIIRLLNLAEHKKVVSVGLNLPSHKMKFKDLIKVEGRELNEKEINRVAILAPQASINIIRNYQIIKKFPVKIPQIVDYVIVCPNPKCISNHENMDSKFVVINHGQNIKLKCYYCEKIFNQDEIREYKNN